MNLIQNQNIFVKKSKTQLFKNLLQKGNMKTPKHLKYQELAYRMSEMEVQKLEKGIFIGDSAATSHMTSDMTGLYNLQKISGSVMIGNGQNIRCSHKGLPDVMCIKKMDQLQKTHGK